MGMSALKEPRCFPPPADFVVSYEVRWLKDFLYSTLFVGVERVRETLCPSELYTYSMVPGERLLPRSLPRGSHGVAT